MNTRWYRDWIGANALAELLGLGGSALVLLSLATWLDESSLRLLAIILGTLVEGSAVGILQARLLRRIMPGLSGWWRATMLGAGLAWVLGMLPSLLIDFSAGSGDEVMIEPALPVILLLAAAMGLVLGILLALPQVWVLRRQMIKPWRWVTYNMLAWMLGMTIIFAGIQTADFSAAAWQPAVWLALTLLLAGACVGAVHGRFFLNSSDFKPTLAP